MNRIYIKDIPIDHISDDMFEDFFNDILAKEKHNLVFFLSFADYLRARVSASYRKILASAALVYPRSPLLRWAYRSRRGSNRKKMKFLSDFDFTIQLLIYLEKNDKSVFLWGEEEETLTRAETSLRASFPTLKIVGRYSSKVPRRRVDDVLLAIKKSSPTLLLAGKGVSAKRISNYLEVLHKGVIVFYPEGLSIFSGKKKKHSDKELPEIINVLITLLFPWRWPLGVMKFFFVIFFLFSNIGKLPEGDKS